MSSEGFEGGVAVASGSAVVSAAVVAGGVVGAGAAGAGGGTGGGAGREPELVTATAIPAAASTSTTAPMINGVLLRWGVNSRSVVVATANGFGASCAIGCEPPCRLGNPGAVDG